MKKRYVLLLLLAVLLLVGCGRKQEMTDANKIGSDQTGELNDPVNRTEASAATGVPSVDPADMLTPEGACEVALNHAQVPKEDAVGLHANLEIEDGIPQYEVDFRDGHIEYEYHIHAETGEVLEFERDD